MSRAVKRLIAVAAIAGGLGLAGCADSPGYYSLSAGTTYPSDYYYGYGYDYDYSPYYYTNPYRYRAVSPYRYYRYDRPYRVYRYDSDRYDRYYPTRIYRHRDHYRPTRVYRDRPTRVYERPTRVYRHQPTRVHRDRPTRVYRNYDRFRDRSRHYRR